MKEKKSIEERKRQIAKKYSLDFDKLEAEQNRLAKDLQIKDKYDFLHAEKYAGFDVIFLKNKILCGVIICDKNYEIIDKAYVFERVRFPYVPGFRNYRELPAMLAAIEKINEKPDIVFINAEGITHARLGLASHFGLATSIPTIGVSDTFFDSEISEKKDGEDIIYAGKKVGKIVIEKRESNPIFVSPGNNISIKSAYELTKKNIISPHKKPEPLYLAAKYIKQVKKELALDS